MLPRWCMPIIVPDTMQQDIPLITSCLGGRLVYLLTSVLAHPWSNKGIVTISSTWKICGELRCAYQLAVDAANKNHQKNKRAYDSKIHTQHLEEGDRLLIRAFGGTGKQKLKDKWNSLPYTVVEKLPHLPVYRLKPENGVGGAKTLHRDHLLLVGQLIRLPEVVEEVGSPRPPRTRRNREMERELREDNNNKQ